MVARKFVGGALALAVIGSMGAFGVARADEGRGGPWDDHHGPFFGSLVPPFITLSDAQKAQIRQIQQQGRADWRAQAEQGRALHEKIQIALASESALDKALLTNLVQQENDLHARGAQEWLTVAEKVHDVLTPDQRKQVVETTQKIHALHDQLHTLMGNDNMEGWGHGPH